MPVHSTLTKDFGRYRRELPPMWEKAALKASAISVEEVRKLTPRGHKINKETGVDEGPSDELRDSVKPIKPTKGRSIRRGGITTYWTAGAYSDDPVAGWVERGTRAHPIPRAGSSTLLRFWSDRQLYIRKRANHPGMLGVHMFARGAVRAEKRIADDVETRLDVVFR
jgi:hypothetical protein